MAATKIPDQERKPMRPMDGGGEEGEEKGPKRLKVERPNSDSLLRRMRKVDPNQARRYRQRTGE